MVESTLQGAGVGSQIVEELCDYLSQHRMERIRLGWMKANPQATRFWLKNGFVETRVIDDSNQVIVAERVI